MSTKKIVIQVYVNEDDYKSKFQINSENMHRYEIIGVLELALEGIKRQCMKETFEKV